MKKKYFNLFINSLLFGILLVYQVGCNVDDKDLQPATYSSNPDVFTDAFSPGLNYSAFGGSDPLAFQVDTEIRYAGLASMRFEVPDFGAAEGAYAGGSFFAIPGRDLSGYDCLTFWAKASEPAAIDVIGFGNDLGENKYQVSLSGLNVNSNWKKYYIPIPDPSKLTMEKGLLFYSTGPQENRGYTLWLDEVKFEKLGTISNPRPSILNGEERPLTTSQGQTYTIEEVSESFSIPDGTTQTVNLTKSYFTFSSSNPAVATVNDSGVVSIVGSGTATITASVGDTQAAGSLIINSTGDFIHAPVPTNDAADVISIFSDVYTNVPVDYYNGYWEPFQTTTSSDFAVDGDNILSYENFNFVGIQFANPTVDASQMSFLHLDIYVPAGTNAQSLKITLRDFGSDGVDGGDDDTNIVRTLSASDLVAGQWNGIDLSIDGETKSRLGLIIFEEGVGLSNFFVDNIYFYKTPANTSDVPLQSAPTPTRSASDVISIFSNAYTNVSVNTYRTDWSQAVLEDVLIAGKAVKKYSSLDFVGIETVSQTVDASSMTHLHIDVWSPNFTNFGIKLVDFGADGVFGGDDDSEYQINFESPMQSQWIGYDIPLSDFVDLSSRAHLAQYILVSQPSGSSTVFVDNFYFYNDGGNGGGNNGGGNNGGGNTGAAPSVSAPAPPNRNSSNVRSIFSNAYTNVVVDTYRTDWSAADFEQVNVSGQALLKYFNMDYVGIETVSQTVDASTMTHLHVDIWSPNFTNFLIKLVDFGADGSFGGGDDSDGVVNFPAPLQSGWISYDIPLSDFADLRSRAHLAQYIFSGTPVGGQIVYVDNFYFYNANASRSKVVNKRHPRAVRP